MNRFTYLSYYFAARPDSNFQYTKATLALGLLLIAAGIFFAYYREKKMTDKIARRILKDYPSKLTRYGFAILFLMGVRELGIPYLSMRIWWFVLLALFIRNALKLFFGYKKEYEEREHKEKRSKTKNKYLPKKKK